LFFLYLIIIIYLSETLLYFYLPNEQKNLVDINKRRIEIAKKNNLNFDSRHGITAYLEERKKNADLSIPFYFNKTDFSLGVTQERIIKNQLIPFRGPINKQILSCNEDLKYKLINNDKYGFKNPNSVYDRKIKIALIGDSYAEGLCEDETNDIAGHLRKINYNTINLGVSGSGPLVSLGIVREYLSKLDPDFVVYLYFEGNDLNDLNWEKKTYLLNYLDPNYKINYLKKYNEIEQFLENHQKEIVKEIENFDLNDYSKKNRNSFNEILKDLLEISNIKGILRSSFSNSDKKIDLDLFYEVLQSIDYEVRQNGSKLIFVYLPTWSRYYTKFNKDKFIYNKKKEILDYLNKNHIHYIDFEKILSNTKNKENFFPLGFVGHYNSKGYEKISNLIKDSIENN